MNIRIKLTTNNIITYLITSILLLSLIPQISYANRADYEPETIRIVCKRDCNDSRNTLEIQGIKGSLWSSNVKTRGFEMRISPTRTLAGSGSSVTTGTTLTYENKGSGYDAQGSWFFSGGQYDSPDMNNQWYRLGNSKDNAIRVGEGWVGVKVKPPENQNPIRFETTGPVSCNNSTRVCTTGPGTGNASITINFPGTKADVFGGIDRNKTNNFNPDVRTDEAEFRFRSTSYTYNFTVNPPPNSTPTVSCIAPFNISYTSAEARWSYNDVEGDAQTNAHIQVSTDSNFNNIVESIEANGNGTTRTVDNLNHSTTYYTRVRVKNAINTDWTGYSTCAGSFRTLTNNGPTFSVTGVSSSPNVNNFETYSIANVIWTYSDPENDPQTAVEIQRSTNPNFLDGNSQIDRFSNNMRDVRSKNISGLLPGETYYIRIRVENGPNGVSGWSNVRAITMPNYPVPQVTYSISKFGDSSTVITNGQTLVLKTGDSVNANWSITDNVGLQSCSLSTSGGGNLPSSVPGQLGEEDFRNSLSGIGFSRNINNKKLPTITEDRIYNVNLNCTGRPAKTIRTIDQTIDLKVESWPIITSCSIDGDSTVQEGQTSVNIKATVGNITTYKWTAGQDRSGSLDKNIGNKNSPIPTTFSLDYKDMAFGRYTPWVSVTKLVPTAIPPVATSRTVIRNCETVSNLGSSNIREVN
jgi:hypothetical protein